MGCLKMHYSVLTLAVIASVCAGGAATAQGQSTRSGYHVTICHRTGSASNPYIAISPDARGVVDGHMDHEQTGNGLGGDIIPEFTFMGRTFSKNLSLDLGDGVSGLAILANGCRLPTVRKTPTPTPKPPGPTPTPPVPVPEPITLVMFGTGLASIGFAARKRFGRKGAEDCDKNT